MNSLLHSCGGRPCSLRAFGSCFKRVAIRGFALLPLTRDSLAGPVNFLGRHGPREPATSGNPYILWRMSGSLDHGKKIIDVVAPIPNASAQSTQFHRLRSTYLEMLSPYSLAVYGTPTNLL